MASLLSTPTEFLFSLPRSCSWEALIHASDLPHPGAERQPGRELSSRDRQVLEQILSSHGAASLTPAEALSPGAQGVLVFVGILGHLVAKISVQQAVKITGSISLLGVGDVVWGMFSHNTKVQFKNTLFCRLSLSTVFPHASIIQQHMPAFLP